METRNYAAMAALVNSGTVYSAAINAQFLLGATAQATFTDSTAAGTLSLQASNDPGTPINWNAIPNTSATVSAGATTMTPIQSAPFAYQWIRVVWVSSGGAGTITCNLHGMGG